MSAPRLLTKNDYYFPVGVVLEAFLCGGYTVLFVVAMWIWRQRRTSTSLWSLSAALYLSLSILMWIVACLHLGIDIRRLLRVFILELEVTSLPTTFRLNDGSQWDTIAHMALSPIMIYLGDILVVYRTYIVWNRNLWVIALPLLLDVVNLALNIMCLYWYTHPGVIPFEKTAPWFLALYPLVFAQNVLTTGLLSYKIWAQHRHSLAHGVIHNAQSRTLGYVARIMIESAMFYTLQLLIIIVLISIDHPATFLFTSCMVPSIGIVFVFMAVRIHFDGGSSASVKSANTRNFPTWFRNSEGDMELSGTASANGAGRVDLAFRIPDNKSTLGRSISDDNEALSSSLSCKAALHPVT